MSKNIVGVDEAGRGCLMGRVFAGAVIWDDNTVLPKNVVIRDSKKMSPAQRNVARKFIEENAVAWAVSSADEKLIDKINILKATMHAMHESISKIQTQKEIDELLIDGSLFNPFQHIPYKCVVSGDNIHRCIAAASILAKTHHDEYIMKLLEENPYLNVYNIQKNMGYGTKAHMDGLCNHGYSPFHRLSFKLPTSAPFEIIQKIEIESTRVEE